MTTRELYCDKCARIRPFAQPPCVEDHADGCPEWACADCGAAVVIAPLVLLVDRSSPVELRRRAGATGGATGRPSSRPRQQRAA